MESPLVDGQSADERNEQSKTERGPVDSTRQSTLADWSLVILLAALVFLLDRVTKMLVVQNLAPLGPGYYEPILGDFVGFGYTTNTGAAFGLFRDYTVYLSALAIIAVPFLLFYRRFLPLRGWLANLCIGLMLGGTLGNLVDRVQQGYVVDFIAAGIGNLRWPSFNVADSAFVIGVVLIVLFVLFHPEPTSPRRDDR